MRSERLPLWAALRGGTHRGIDIGGRSLGYVGKFLAGGRVGGFEVFAGRGLVPCAIDEMSEAAVMMVEPAEGFFWILGRGAVLHGHEFFSNAHSIVLPRFTSCSSCRL